MLWWKLMLVPAALAVGVSIGERKGMTSRVHEDGGVHSEYRLGSNGQYYGGRGGAIPDRVEVFSSALRILPRKTEVSKSTSVGGSEKARSARSYMDDAVNPEGSWDLVETKSLIKRSPLESEAEKGGSDFSKVSKYESEKRKLAKWIGHDGDADDSERAKRSPGGLWRTPREYQFVTRERSNHDTGAPRSARLLEPESSASRYYPDERPYYPAEGRRNGDHFGRRSGYQAPHKRIIYYAHLPEIVRRPGEWTPPRPIYGGGFPHNPRDNEILPRPDGHFADTGTRVSSSIIGFSDKHETLKNPGYQDDLSSPTFTIIDAEPPYNYENRPVPPPLPPPDRFDNRFDHDRYDYDRYDQRYNGYRNYADPYRHYYDDRRPLPPPRRHQIMLPPQSVTVVRKPLDVRPLDPDTQDYTTQGPPYSTSSTARPSSSSTTSSPPLSSYERTYRF